MFLHLRVVLWGVGFPACITGHMTRGICIQGGLPRGGLHLHPGGLHPRGIWKTSLGLPLGGSASRGVCIQGVGQIPHPPRYMGYYGIWSTGGQYASYWNAFLFIAGSLFIELGCTRDLGKGWRETLALL